MARPRTLDDAVRRRLLEHASAAIATGGPASLSVRAVAAAAGTTTAAVYSLFGSREALVQEVVAEGFRRFAEYLAGAPHSADPLADLLALGVAYRASALASPHFYRVMFAPPSTDSADRVEAAGAQARAADGGAREAVARPTFLVLRDAVARALPDRGLAETEETALRLWSQAHGLVSLELAGMLPGTAAERAARYLAALRGARL